MPTPNKSGQNTFAASSTPRKWKQILLAFAVVYPLVLFLNAVLVPQIAFMHPLLRTAVFVFCMASALTYALPWANRKAATWLAS